MTKAIISIADWQIYTFQVDFAFDLRVRGLCGSPYPGHRHGCPKFNSGYPDCPPDAPKVFDFFDERSDFFFVINEFNIEEHIKKMAAAHPRWTDRQLRCCLYWQSTARKQLSQKLAHVLAQNKFCGFISTTCPEAMGVNVTETVQRIGIKLEWPPKQIARQIALVGRPKADNSEY
jgi:hypothetical protein